MKLEINYQRHRFKIDFEIIGEDHPSTMVDPPEYPEVEILKIELYSDYKKSWVDFTPYEKILSQVWLDRFESAVIDACWESERYSLKRRR